MKVNQQGLFLGVDVGSVSTNLVLVDERGELMDRLYLATSGQPIRVIQEGLAQLNGRWGRKTIHSVGTTGSGRQLADALLGADVVKNEITAHAVAAERAVPGVRTILEIGGQDSKLILLRDGIVADFSMNTVCAAGTGSFLDRQASRLMIPIEQMGALARRATVPAHIAGRCAVFAESDMIHKQQTGVQVEDIVAGLCEALVRNFLSNLAKGKKLEPPVVFQGGVARNGGMVAAFEKALRLPVTVPENCDVMGAYGAALLAQARWVKTKEPSSFRGWQSAQRSYSARRLECEGCANHCEIVQILSEQERLACWGDRCGKWSGQNDSVPAKNIVYQN
jgi:predicted CoA-substrate-specific enzyme activase